MRKVTAFPTMAPAKSVDNFVNVPDELEVLEEADTEVESIFNNVPPKEEQMSYPKSRISTRIPAAYHVVRKTAQFPGGNDEHEVTKGSDGLWHATVFPSLKPYGREEVLLLENAFNQMLETEEARIDRHAPIQGLIRKAAACSQTLNEVVRQISAECPERGQILVNIGEHLDGVVEDLAENCLSSSTQHDEVTRAALAEARASFIKEQEAKEEQVEQLTDMYENGEENISHLNEQLAEWQNMQTIFRDELDAKFQQHTAFRREQESWRTLRKELDMEVLVLRKQVETLYAQVKAVEEDKMALEDKLYKIEKNEGRYHKDAERRLSEMLTAQTEAQARESALEEEVAKLRMISSNVNEVADRTAPSFDSESKADVSHMERELDDETDDIEPNPQKTGGPTRLLDFLHKKHKPKGKKAEVRSIDWLQEQIGTIWRSKHESDNIDDDCGHRHEKLPEFVYEYMLQLHKTKPVADKEAFIFMDTLMEHRHESKSVELFNKFLNESYSLDACNFYVFLRHEIATSPYGVQYPDTLEPNNARIAWVDPNRTFMVSRSVLASILDMKAIITFNSKVDKASVKCNEADVMTALGRAPTGSERKIQQVKYEDMCLALFSKGRSARLKQVKKALFKGKTTPQPVFVDLFKAMDPSVSRRHISRLYVEAAKISPPAGVNFKAFVSVAQDCGLFEDCFRTAADEKQRKEDPTLKRLITEAVKESWSTEMEGAITDVMRHLDVSGRPNDSATLMVLAELRVLFMDKIGTDCPGYTLNATFQHLILAALKAVIEMTYPTTNVYPATYEQLDTFKLETKSLATFLLNSVAAASAHNQPR